MFFLVNSHTNATSDRWHLWEIDLRFALNSTPGWPQTLKRKACWDAGLNGMFRFTDATDNTYANTRWCLHPTPYTPTPYTLLHPAPTPYTLHPNATDNTYANTRWCLHPTPYTPYTLHTLHPTPFTLHPTTYTLHPTPYTLHP